MESIKLTVVGDGGVGKTCLLISYAEDFFEQEYVPTVFDNYSVTVHIDNRVAQLSLWDTAGQDEYAKLRQLSYPQTDIFLICYSIDWMTSLENAKNKWVPELRAHDPNTPIILIGTKTDLRFEKNGIVESKVALELSKSVGIDKYLECSAKTRDGVQALFDVAVRMVFKSHLSSKSKQTRS